MCGQQFWNQGPPVPDRPPEFTGFPSPLGVSSAQCQSVTQAECTQENTTLGGTASQLPALAQLGAAWRGAALFKSTLVPEILSQVEVVARLPPISLLPPSVCALFNPSGPSPWPPHSPGGLMTSVFRLQTQCTTVWACCGAHLRVLPAGDPSR